MKRSCQERERREGKRAERATILGFGRTKDASPHVADRQNCYRVYDSFDFQSGVPEVQQTVGRNRN
ncbi:hypothetical protein GCM10022408_21170 [Hymenobacter fastidiosus]|uniref:Uncharacterized protein n=1 Tax=Hymenobacter fastidiosus TaxID=486264 RepID=A0ABP7SAM8_9BACT